MKGSRRVVRKDYRPNRRDASLASARWVCHCDAGDVARLSAQIARLHRRITTVQANNEWWLFGSRLARQLDVLREQYAYAVAAMQAKGYCVRAFRRKPGRVNLRVRALREEGVL